MLATNREIHHSTFCILHSTMQALSKSLSPRLRLMRPVSKTHLPSAIPRLRATLLSQATGAGDPKVHSGDPPGQAPSMTTLRCLQNFQQPKRRKKKATTTCLGMRWLRACPQPVIRRRMCRLLLLPGNWSHMRSQQLLMGHSFSRRGGFRVRPSMIRMRWRMTGII